MSLLRRVMDIMDLNNPEVAMIESSKKLCNTYMIVNGTLEKVHKFEWGLDVIFIKTRTGALNPIKFSSLDIYLPEAGLYPSPNGDALLIQKIPYRQWLKSFSESFYQVEYIGTNPSRETKGKTTLYDVFKSKRTDIFVDVQRIVWYWGNKIGVFNEKNDLMCTDSRFYQELKDWSKNDFTDP